MKTLDLGGVADLNVYNAVLGTTWNVELTGAKTQTVSIEGVSAGDTANVGAVYNGDRSGASYDAFVEQGNQFRDRIMNGFAETVDGGVKFTIFGDTNTVNIPILVEVIHP